MLWRSTRNKTPEKKVKDIASSETAPQGGVDVGDEEDGVRAASAPGFERRRRKESSDIALDAAGKNTWTYKHCTNTTPAISSPPSMSTTDTPSHPTPTNTEEELPKEAELDSSFLASGGDKSSTQCH
eukprot:13409130-Ditylum_brightwellii.AAC.1